MRVGALGDGPGGFIRRGRERDGSLSLLGEDTVRRSPSVGQEELLSLGTESTSTLILDCPGSRTVKNKCLLFQPLHL